jgi:hypothetical protein
MIRYEFHIRITADFALTCDDQLRNSHLERLK